MLLALSINDEVTVRLKWGATEYSGKLVSVDSYMNIQLSGAQEWQEGRSSGLLGQVLIRYVLAYSGSSFRSLGWEGVLMRVGG